MFLVSLKSLYSYTKKLINAYNYLFFPFSAKIKKKMLYSSSFDALKKCLVGVQKYIQVRVVKILFNNTKCIFLTGHRWVWGFWGGSREPVEKDGPSVMWESLSEVINKNCVSSIYFWSCFFPINTNLYHFTMQ